MTAHAHAAPRGRTVGAASVGAPVALDAGLNRIYQPCDAVDACIEVVDATTNALITRVPVTRSWRPPMIAIDATRHLVYVASAVFDPAGARGVVTVVDGRTAAVVATIAVGPGPQAIAVDPARNRVYVSGQTGVDTDAAVTIVDGATRRILTTVAIGPYGRYYDNPAGLAVHVATHTVYATNPLEGVVYAIDGSSGAVVRSFTVGDAPTAVAVDPTTGTVAVATTRGVVVLPR
jgi:DNA-binding beta-propeller fold protein YncE